MHTYNSDSEQLRFRLGRITILPWIHPSHVETFGDIMDCGANYLKVESVWVVNPTQHVNQNLAVN